MPGFENTFGIRKNRPQTRRKYFSPLRTTAISTRNDPAESSCFAARIAGRKFQQLNQPLNPTRRPPLSGLLHHLAILPDNHWQLLRAILGADILLDASKRAFSAGHKGRNFSIPVSPMSVLFHAPINSRTNSISCSDEMASRFTGRLRLSQIAQRVVSGR